jgi:hypothetical protein
MSETTFESRRLRKIGVCSGRHKLDEAGFTVS